jgi:metal-responsive CopG/Arc/MetJ family transcriptional regulator
MKIIKDASKKFRTVTLRLPEKVMEQIDKVADKNDLSRQELIAAILQQVLDDNKFILKVIP